MMLILKVYRSEGVGLNKHLELKLLKVKVVPNAVIPVTKVDKVFMKF